MPFFSVILPTFNRAHLIARAIESVRRQTFADWELIIIDDGSRDETFALVRDLILSDERMQYHFSQNRGLPRSRNLGCSMAGGKYYTFLDSDDEYHRDHLQLRYDMLASKPWVELLHGGVSVIGDAYVRDKFDPSKRIHISECIVGGTFVIRRDLWSRLDGFRDIAYGDDHEFYSRALEHGALIETAEQPTYLYYRTEADSLCAIVDREGVEGIAKFRSAAA
jgi:glycosyltransferase involved in cell wall biosynthesis